MTPKEHVVLAHDSVRKMRESVDELYENIGSRDADEDIKLLGMRPDWFVLVTFLFGGFFVLATMWLVTILFNPACAGVF